MSHARKKIALCIRSTAAGGAYETADCHHQACPLALTHAQAGRCPCKQRTPVGRIGSDGSRFSRPTKEQIVRVLECRFPETFSRDVIKNPEAFAAYLRRVG